MCGAAAQCRPHPLAESAFSGCRSVPFLADRRNVHPINIGGPASRLGQGQARPIAVGAAHNSARPHALRFAAQRSTAGRKTPGAHAPGRVRLAIGKLSTRTEA